jgi:Mus7/MMS22 family
VIFRSRKFANLRHEGTGYPKFFKDRNWDLLESYDPKDTAFVLFVKLIVQAAKDDQGNIQGKLSLKTKKLLSLAVPVASLPFSKTNPPTLHELTMFYNRLCAVAIAVYLELDEYDSRTRQAREYIKFADADDTTRSAVIGGMMNWAIMMVNREIRLDAMTTWIEEMAQVLSAELKETSSLNISAGEVNKANSLRRDRLILLSCVLLGAVRHILKAYIGLGQYPEPSLLCKSSRYIGCTC